MLMDFLSLLKDSYCGPYWIWQNVLGEQLVGWMSGGSECRVAGHIDWRPWRPGVGSHFGWRLY